MLARCLIAPVLLLPAVAVCAETMQTLSRTEMRPRQVYEFRTDGRTYRAEVIDQKTGECKISASRDGVTFGHGEKAFVLGATRGPQAGVTFVAMGEVKVGHGIELAVEDYGKRNRFLTPDVTSITLLADPAAGGAAHQALD
jgi:hypothetical protein